MRGEFLGVWSETWREIWLPLVDQPLGDNDGGVPEDIFCDLYRELAKALKARPTVETLADIIDNPLQSREAFEKTRAEDLDGSVRWSASLSPRTKRSTSWVATK